MKRTIVFLVFAVLASSLFAQGSHPSTPEERARAIEIAHKMEANPLDASLRPDREWLLKFAIQASDFTVSMCAGSDEYKKKYKYSPELTTQKMASAIAFVLQHQYQAQDKVAQELAAVTGALNAYEQILKADPKHHSEYWDSLLEKRTAGTLKESVTAYVNSKCSGNK